MWSWFINLLQTVFTFSDTVKRNSKEIEDLQAEMRQLTSAMGILAKELQHQRELAKSENERLRLKLENELLKRLPPKDESKS